MKRKYSISFLAAVLVCLSLLGFAYQMSYQKTRLKTEEKNKTEISVPAKGNAAKAELYYLKDLNGFIAVYQKDKQTIYEYTTIRMDELPKDVAKEIENWKSIETTENLYGFLENYSS